MDARTRPDGSARVVVIARDATRQAQYESAMRVAKTPAHTTADPDAGADLLLQHRPAVLVLDQGLPRLALFRLYGMAREDEGQPPIQVVFVGQDDDTGPDDHYLPGEPSTSRVAVQVTSLLSRLDAAGRAGRAPSGSPPAAAPPAASPPRVPQPTLPTPAEALHGAPAAPVSDLPPRAVPTPPASAPAASANGQVGDPVVTVPEQSAVGAAAAPTPAPSRPGRRLDVMLVRIGLVLLILGGLLFLLQMQVNQGPLVAPTPVPSAPTRRPSPSPSPRADVHSPAAFVVSATGF